MLIYKRAQASIWPELLRLRRSNIILATAMHTVVLVAKQQRVDKIRVIDKGGRE